MTGQPNTSAGFPQVTAPLVEPETGLIVFVWYAFLRQLWLRVGGAVGNILTGALAGVVPLLTIGQSVVALVAGELQKDGNVRVNTPVEGDAPQIVALGNSPFVFHTVFQGTLVVFGGEVELSRDTGTTWYKVGLAGGAVPVLVGDEIRITWYSPVPPPVTFFPGGA